jgi:hypothetical protein
MTKLNKIIYWTMLVICLSGITSYLILGNFIKAMSETALLIWVGVAWINERRCNKLEKQLENKDERFNTKS